MIDKLTTDEIRKILKFISKGYKVPQIVYDTIYKIAKLEVEDKKRVVLVKRDPNIGRGRIQAMFVKIIEGNSIQIYPPQCSEYGADFDGDSAVCDYFYFKKDKLLNCKIGDLFIKEPMDLIEEKVKENGIVIKKFRPKERLSTYSINPSNGSIEIKDIEEFSIHENIEMYKINDSKSRFKDFHVSYDHSLIIFDEDLGKIKKCSPREIIQNPKGKFLIRKVSPC